MNDEAPSVEDGEERFDDASERPPVAEATEVDPGRTTAGEGSLVPAPKPPAEEVIAYIDQAAPPIKHALMEAVLYRSEYHSGPLPSPRSLAEYNKAVPGLGDRIVTSFEKETEHRHQQEKRELGIFQADVEARQGDRRRAMNNAFYLSVLVFTFSFVLILMGHDLAGSGLAGGSLVSIVTTFILGQRRSETDGAPGLKSGGKKPPKRRSSPGRKPSLPPGSNGKSLPPGPQ